MNPLTSPSLNRKLFYFIVLPFLYFYLFHVYTVDETEQVVITSFGKIIETDLTPGLGIVTLPWHSIHSFEKRYLIFDAELPRVCYTKDKKQLLVDYFMPFRIVDPVLFFETVNNVDAAKTRIDDYIYEKVNANIGKNSFNELVKEKRVKITEEIAKDVISGLRDNFGIEVPYMRFNRVNYPEQNRAGVYNRMKNERKKISKEYRAQGAEKKNVIVSSADALVQSIRADSTAKAGKITGEGMQEAAKIYNRAYREEASDFYNFYISMETAKKAYSNGERIFVFTKKDAFYGLLMMKK